MAWRGRESAGCEGEDGPGGPTPPPGDGRARLGNVGWAPASLSVL